MNKLLFKLGAQYALRKLGEGTTYAGFWAWYHINITNALNPHLETQLTNIFCALAGLGLVMVNEDWHRKTA